MCEYARPPAGDGLPSAPPFIPLIMLDKKARPAPESFPNAESLRVGIVHARWNRECIDALVSGCVRSLTKAGVKEENIVIESVPGSWELPIATSRYV